MPWDYSRVVVLTLAVGCGQAPPTYWTDVMPILEGRCTNCHYDGGIGGFSLESYDLASAAHALIADATQQARMPPWPAAEGPEYSYDWRLTEDEIATLTAWSEDGAPEGDEADAGQPLERAGSSLSRVDLTLTMPEAYTPNPDPTDDYRCFPIQWTGTETQYITGFNALPGNDQVVHHIAAFLIPEDNMLGDSVFEQLETWDADEEGAGYSCFGGPSGPTGDLQLPIQQIAQWVPGSQGLDFPEGTGIEVAAGAWIVLQVHYFVDGDTADTEDQTAIEFRLDDSVDHRAAYAPYLNTLWAIGQMTIPAGSEGISYNATGDPRAFFEFLNPSLSLDDGFVIHGSMLHMHRLGSSASVEVQHGDGSTSPLLTIPEWDFDWQFLFQLAEPVTFSDGDEMSVTCTFDNGGADAVDVNWGEGTDDEMCVANLYISQR